MEPLITVIVPIYQTENYLDRCIESIVHQSYENLEIILVEDGSPDLCPYLCDQWALKDPRIQVIHKENGGLSDARNTGIAVARGVYLLFVDSDDYIKTTMVRELFIAMKESSTTMALCNIKCVDEYGNSAGEALDSPIKNEIISAEELLPRLAQGSGSWFYIVVWNKLYHRSLLQGDVFPSGKWCEDAFVAAQLIWKAKRIACIDHQHYIYTQNREGSITQSKSELWGLDLAEALEQRYRFYHSIGMYELLHDTRAIMFRELENYSLKKRIRSEAEKKRLKEIKKMYAKLKGKTGKEQLRWLVFRVSSGLEYQITMKSRKLRNMLKRKFVIV